MVQPLSCTNVWHFTRLPQISLAKLRKIRKLRLIMVELIFHGQFTEIETDTLQKQRAYTYVHTHSRLITLADFHWQRTFGSSLLHAILNSIKSFAH